MCPIITAFKKAALKDAGLYESNSAVSCTGILEVRSSAPSSYYWLQSTDGSVIRVFCDMTQFPCQPGFTEEGGNCNGKYNIYTIELAMMYKFPPILAYTPLSQVL